MFWNINYIISSHFLSGIFRAGILEIICQNEFFKITITLRSGPMRRVSNEPRQVRKEAAVVVRSMCCGVPGLFFWHPKID